MSRDIEYIANVTAFGIFDAEGQFSIQGGFPTNPDEVVIRSVTYSPGLGTPHTMGLVHSNLTHQIIACVLTSGQFTSSPGTRIQTRNPIPNVLTFTMMAPSTPPTPAKSDVDMHEICINMDFIKWKRS